MYRVNFTVAENVSEGKMASQINNSASEKAVLTGLLRHGIDAYIDVDDIINVNTFDFEENQILYSCIEKVLVDSSSVDLPSLLSAAKDLGLDSLLEEETAIAGIKSLIEIDIELANVRKHAVKLKKLEIARNIKSKVKQIISDISNVTGDESIDEILSIAESPIFAMSATLNGSVEDKPITLGKEVSEYVSHVEENPSSFLGLSSGFIRFDEAIGGGFRRKCVDLIAARPKVGKSMLADNVAIHISEKLNVPVLVLDTEMSKEDHFNRILANFSGININDIASGKFTESACEKEKVYKAVERFDKIPIDYISIAGKPFEETLSVMRRWLFKNVGYDDNGRIKDCMIIYDYLKLMDSGQISDSLKEYQVLGFQITQLHNFCVQYDCPCLSFVQLNRDGITKESTDVVSGSDRLVWLCSSFSIFKKKSDEEIAEDQGENGNRKLVPVVTRHGAGLDDYDYINIAMLGETARIIEKPTRNEIKFDYQKQQSGFEVDDFDNEESPF